MLHRVPHRFVIPKVTMLREYLREPEAISYHSCSLSRLDLSTSLSALPFKLCYSRELLRSRCLFRAVYEPAREVFFGGILSNNGRSFYTYSTEVSMASIEL